MSKGGKVCWRCDGWGMIKVKVKRRPDDPPPRMFFGEVEDADVMRASTPCVICGGTGVVGKLPYA